MYEFFWNLVKWCFFNILNLDSLVTEQNKKKCLIGAPYCTTLKNPKYQIIVCEKKFDLIVQYYCLQLQYHCNFFTKCVHVQACAFLHTCASIQCACLCVGAYVCVHTVCMRDCMPAFTIAATRTRVSCDRVRRTRLTFICFSTTPYVSKRASAWMNQTCSWWVQKSASLILLSSGWHNCGCGCCGGYWYGPYRGNHQFCT